MPFAPGTPGLPGIPGCPRAPGKPGAPTKPAAPVLPFSPGIPSFPWGPCGPDSPGWPGRPVSPMQERELKYVIPLKDIILKFKGRQCFNANFSHLILKSNLFNSLDYYDISLYTSFNLSTLKIVF